MGIDPPEIPPATPGQPAEAPPGVPPASPQPDIPSPVTEPGEPPRPDELPGQTPDEVPSRGPGGPDIPSPVTDSSVQVVSSFKQCKPSGDVNAKAPAQSTLRRDAAMQGSARC